MDGLLWEHIEAYLRHLEVDLSASPNTIAAYRNDLTQLYQYLSTTGSRNLDPLTDGTSEDSVGWASLSRVRIVGFVVALKEKGYATTTVARKIAAMKSFFHFLQTRGIIDADPTENLDSPRIDKALPRSLTDSEVSGLLEQPAQGSSPDDIRDTAMLRLLYSTGLRVSELVALNLEDLDLSSGYVRCISRNGRERIIPIDSNAVQALETYLVSARNGLIRRRDEQALFVNHHGDRLTRQGFWLILKEHARRAGLPEDITPQALRHSFAVRLIDDHTDLRAVQELLGHANIATTQIYTQVAGRSRPSDDRNSKPELVGT
ncbi:MAG TPA: tyrosine recombinase [Chloroflexota bacterium]|nr:tyrosine recombinase [Chloroflexota bacterium]